MTWAFINVNSGKALDVPFGNPVDGLPLQQFTFHQGQNQLWELDPVPPYGFGHFKIRSVATNLFLTVPDNSFEEAKQVVQQSAVDHPSQVWLLLLVGNAQNSNFTFYIINGHSDLTLDVDHSRTDDQAPVLQYHRYGGNNQLWMLKRF